MNTETTPNATPENKLVEPAAQALNQRIPGDVVNKATAELPDNQRSAIRRLHAYYAEHNLSLGEVAKLIGYDSGAVVGLIFRGKYDARLDTVVKEIEGFFDLQDKRAQGRKLNFIHTAMTRKLWQICEASLEFQKVAFIFGDQQIGKTEALKAYRDAHNHGSTIYVRMPTRGTLSNFLVDLARQLRIGENLSMPRLRERIKGAFDDRMLLIVDEAHQCISEGGRSSRSIDSIEFIREIFDEKQCGLVLCATNVFRDAMESGPVRKLLGQIKRRRLCSLQLPNVPTRADLVTFAAAYKLPPSQGAAQVLEKQMVEDEALGMWLTLLRMGAKLAAQRNQKMDWGHVLSANAGLKELEGQKF